jgi:Tol biopolymer transport system component
MAEKENEKMHLRVTPVIALVMLSVSGCPLGSPNDHYRPHGHQDTTIAISPKDDEILFNAAGKGGRDLYILHLSDLKVRRIAETPEYETDASFSPDGSSVVYTAGVPGDRADHIFVMKADGTLKAQLTRSKGNDVEPRFSPDGSMVVFARDKTYNWGGLAANWEGGGVICVVGADGKGERQLTPDDGYAFSPSFTKDGRSVRYSTSDGLFTIPTDRSAVPKKRGPLIPHATYSPDHKTVVFSEGQYSGDCELFLADVELKAKTPITNSDHGCFRPIFTNHGDRVYFLMEEWPKGPSGSPQSSIWTVKIDGTEQKQITDLSMFTAPLTWKPPKTP